MTAYNRPFNTDLAHLEQGRAFEPWVRSRPTQMPRQGVLIYWDDSIQRPPSPVCARCLFLVGNLPGALRSLYCRRPQPSAAGVNLLFRLRRRLRIQNLPDAHDVLLRARRAPASASSRPYFPLLYSVYIFLQSTPFIVLPAGRVRFSRLLPVWPRNCPIRALPNAGPGVCRCLPMTSAPL